MEQTMSVSNPLGTERIGKLMVRFAVPSIIALVVNSLYNMVDQIFIGNGVGYLGNAATNVILPIMTVVLAVGLMIGDGCAAFTLFSLRSLSMFSIWELQELHGQPSSVRLSTLYILLFV